MNLLTFLISGLLKIIDRYFHTMIPPILLINIYISLPSIPSTFQEGIVTLPIFIALRGTPYPHTWLLI